MKYLTKEASDSFLVRLYGSDQDQLETANLAENIFNTSTKDTYAGKVIGFKNRKEFKNFLFWKQIFGRIDRNKRFNFLKLARPSAKETREILNKEVASLESLEG